MPPCSREIGCRRPIEHHFSYQLSVGCRVRVFLSNDQVDTTLPSAAILCFKNGMPNSTSQPISFDSIASSFRNRHAHENFAFTVDNPLQDQMRRASTHPTGGQSSEVPSGTDWHEPSHSLSRKLGSAFQATSLDDRPTRARCHASAETVFPCASAIVRLECPLHLLSNSSSKTVRDSQTWRFYS